SRSSRKKWVNTAANLCSSGALTGFGPESAIAIRLKIYVYFDIMSTKKRVLSCKTAPEEGRMKRKNTTTSSKELNKRKTRVGKRPIERAPRTLDEFFAKSEEFQATWNRALHVISRVRADRQSLSAASQEDEIDRRQVLSLAGSALRKTKRGTYVAKPHDTLLRILVIPTRSGLQTVAIADSRQASLLAEYWDAVQRYLQRGDYTALEDFRTAVIR